MLQLTRTIKRKKGARAILIEFITLSLPSDLIELLNVRKSHINPYTYNNKVYIAN